jgi:hypothetical protein
MKHGRGQIAVSPWYEVTVMPRGLCLALFVAAGFAGGAAGCGGARAGFDGTTYKDGALAFHVPERPSSWRAVGVEGAALAFRDEAHDAMVLVNGHCGEKDDDAPLVALTNHLILGTTERAVSVEETIPMDGREARHTAMVAKLDGVPRSFDIFVMKKDGCVYDLVYVGAPTSTAAGAPEFERFAHGFRTLRGAEEP